jgi:hypothetical protein
MVGGKGPEKIRRGGKRKVEENEDYSGKKKESVKRGGVRNIPHFGAAPASFGLPETPLKEAKNKTIDIEPSEDISPKKSAVSNGQFLSDQFERESKTFMPGAYYDSSAPHDSDEGRKERNNSRKEVEKELLNPEQMEVFVKWAVELQGNLKGVYAGFDYSREDEVVMLQIDMRSFLNGEVVKAGLVSSREQARQMIEQIMAKSLLV